MWQYIFHPILSYREWRCRRHMAWAVAVANMAALEALSCFEQIVQRPYLHQECEIIEGMLITRIADHEGKGPGFHVDLTGPTVGMFVLEDAAIFEAAVRHGKSKIGRIY